MNNNSTTDIDPVKNWQEFIDGNREALGNIFRLYFEDMVAYGMKIVPSEDTVKDHIQELFVRLWEKWFQLVPVRNVKVYLLICVKNDLLQTSRNNASAKNKLPDEADQFSISVEDFLIEKEEDTALAWKIASSLEKLTARQREVIYLRFYHNMDFPQLAEMMEMNVQSVRNLLFRALEKIRGEVSGSGKHQTSNIELILYNLFSRKSN